jgi:hypothetical protein
VCIDVYYLSSNGNFYASNMPSNVNTFSSTSMQTSIRVLSLMGSLPNNPLPNYGMCFQDSELFDSKPVGEIKDSLEKWFVNSIHSALFLLSRLL